MSPPLPRGTAILSFRRPHSIVLGFLTIAAPLVGLSMLLRMQPRIHLFTRDGRTIVKSVESLEGLESFFAALDEHGVERLAEPPVVLEDS